jgi:signal recognition particle receptor subunit beta
MSRHDEEKRIYMVEKYHKLKSSIKVIAAWKEDFPEIAPPQASTILLNVKKFHNHGSIKELPRIRTKINAEREAAKNQLIDLIYKNPNLSIRMAAKLVGMS